MRGEILWTRKMTDAPRSSLDLSLALTHRPRRNRKADWARRLVRENVLTTNDLIWPIFICRGRKCPRAGRLHARGRAPVRRPGGRRRATRRRAVGSRPSPCFPITDPALRDPNGSEALNSENLVCRACRAIKAAVPQLGLITDVALDPYTSHGHDGVLEGEVILNDESVAILVEQALNQARAGADVIAPSDMMDGRVGAIRAALDAEGFLDVQIMAYAAKYASAFYGPFRDAIGTKAVLVGDKRTYQMDPANSDEALREVAADLEEGADMVMVKPGLPYLDIIRRVKDRFRRYRPSPTKFPENMR